ncbi:hypothetical protein GQX73_g9620 [Xylaria multiplex]|uniref:Heterokaryon incompatibility domain-containing protein n=1 Tax=Xylaria multiplex TaxID=323545 RepID=A0A7C8IMD7_9PEZI|nr:hypothetical protein GQX73_g9620 [Xylaria multiplex]
MRLLNSRSGNMKEFLAEDQTPPYAILSHTWGEDEVSFRDWHHEPRPEVQKKQGYRKIDYCCKQAIAEGLEWIWVDTCCIDKSSSSELSEAINSMFQWYAKAVVCYVYLIDVAYTENATEEEIKSSLENSRWVSRGWTLQELIAPSHVVFYSKDWKNCGTRSELSTTLEAITRIDEPYLNGRPLEHASVAQRMSWASRRTTSRTEDQAYCLLGIFNVNMPLIYGEKSKAFRRLQEAIYLEYPEDHSLYAWGPISDDFSYRVKDVDQVWGSKLIEYDPSLVDQKVFGLFAESPADFMDSGRVVSAPVAYRYFERQSGLVSPTSSIGRATYVFFPTAIGRADGDEKGGRLVFGLMPFETIPVPPGAQNSLASQYPVQQYPAGPVKPVQFQNAKEGVDYFWRKMDEVPYQRIMEVPRDEWRVNIKGYADIYIAIERMNIKGGEIGEDSREPLSDIFVDVVDIVVRVKGDPGYPDPEGSKDSNLEGGNGSEPKAKGDKTKKGILDGALQEIKNHRSDVSRPRVSEAHWEIVRAEKEAQGFNKEAYEYSATFKTREPLKIQTVAHNKNYLLRLEGPIDSVEVVKLAAQLNHKPPVYHGTDDDDKPAIFCKVDASARNSILAYLSEKESRFQPAFIPYSIAAKELSATSAYPTLGVDATMPQYRPSSADDPALVPSQGQYPVWYFFYGTLADSAVLGRLLGIEPSYKHAMVHGGILRMWGGKYKALVNSSGGVVHGSAFLVQDEAQEDILRCYETDKYEVVRCELNIEDKRVKGLTFRFVSDL